METELLARQLPGNSLKIIEFSVTERALVFAADLRYGTPTFQTVFPKDL